MDENQSIFDTKLYTTEKTKLRQLASKYGLAMIFLVLNNTFAPYLFVYINAIFSGNAEIGYSDALVLNAFSAYLFPVIVFFFMFRDECKAFTPDRSYKPFKGEALFMFTAGMSAGVLGTLITQLINAVIDRFFGTGEIEDAFAGMKPQNMEEFAVFSFFICIIAPVAEEVLFRSLLLKPLRAFGDLTAAVVSGTIFGLYHGNFDQFAYAVILGIFFSVICIRYNSILPTTILHAVNNTIVTCAGDLNSACEKAPQQIKLLCEDISAVCSFVSSALLFGGFAALVVCIVKRSFTLHNRNRYLSQSEALLDFVRAPFVIIGIPVMFILFFT